MWRISSYTKKIFLEFPSNLARITPPVTPYSNRRQGGEVWHEQNRLVKHGSQSQEAGVQKRALRSLSLEINLGLGKDNPVNNEIVRMNAVCRTNIPWSGRLPQSRIISISPAQESSLFLKTRMIKQTGEHTQSSSRPHTVKKNMQLNIESLVL